MIMAIVIAIIARYSIVRSVLGRGGEVGEAAAVDVAIRVGRVGIIVGVAVCCVGEDVAGDVALAVGAVLSKMFVSITL